MDASPRIREGVYSRKGLGLDALPVLPVLEPASRGGLFSTLHPLVNQIEDGGSSVNARKKCARS